MPEYIITFSCGETLWADSIEEAHEFIADHGYDCDWTLYEARAIDFSPEPTPEEV